MPQYSWWTNADALTALRGRLYNSNYYTDDELQRYFNESLRLWNALTESYRSDFIFSAGGWINFGSYAGSPRLRSVTDEQLITEMQLMLLENPTGLGPWTGTPQFNLAAMQSTLSKRQNEFIQATRSNMAQLVPIQTLANVQRNYLPDTVLSPERIRFMPAQTLPNHTLLREDTQSFQYFQNSYNQEPGFPEAWSVASEPVLAFDVDKAPTDPGAYDVIALLSGPQFGSSPSLLGVPDDWSMILKYGALADLLAREPEATDRVRSQYCLQRFTLGIQMMQHSNWFLQAAINNFPVDTPDLYDQDWTEPEWEDNQDLWPVMVQGGIDFVKIAPFGTGFGFGGFGGGPFGGTSTPPSCAVTLVANMPIPAAPTDFVQISRDVADVILGMAQRIASFKLGGFDFTQTEYLEKDFYRSAAATNKRLLELGIFNDILYSAGMKENIEETSRT
jgi:hypothetical protein